MGALFFPDNTVLVNFALINRMDLLATLVNGRGMWCATVASECLRSSFEPGLADMSLARNIFGDPLYPESGAEHSDIRTLRDELAEPNEAPHKHLGEAETIAIIPRRSLPGFFVTDDSSAMRLARRNQVQVISTWDLLKIAVNYDFINGDTLWGYLLTLKSQQRGSPAGVIDRATFNEWLV